MNRKLVVVGNSDEVHVGAHFYRAVHGLDLSATLCDTKKAFEAPAWRVKFNWWCRGHRPTRLRQFSGHVVRTCWEFQPAWMLATGIAPLDAHALRDIGNLGVKRLNFLTDDPWNPAHRAPWFMEALPHYDYVFTPRRAVIESLRQIGCRNVSYLPFACAPELHFPEKPEDKEERARLEADVIFAGGADRDRVPYIEALIRAGIRVALYGGYWNRYRPTRSYARGCADAWTLRRAITASKIGLCLVRQANRDGHVMRSFEVPAIGACMLAEDTAEHREIFGDDGKAVAYFRTRDDMVEKARWLLAHDAERRRLAKAGHRLITTGKHTYRDRLETMLQTVSG